MTGHDDGSRGGGQAWRKYLADIRSLASRPKEGAGGKEGPTPDLLQANLFFVVKMAREYASFSVPLEDLLSEGYLGLLEAGERFDHSRGTKFITYASWWIRKRMMNLIGRQTNFIRLPKYKLERLRRLRAAESRLASTLCHPPSTEELTGETGLSRREIDELRTLGLRQVSLDQVTDEESGRRLEEFVPDAAPAEAEEELIEQDIEEVVTAAMEALTEKERFVLCHRFGLAGNQPATLQVIAEHLGLSRERVRQIEAQALRRLRHLVQRRPARPGTPDQSGGRD